MCICFFWYFSCFYIFLIFSYFFLFFLFFHLHRPSPNSHLPNSDLILIIEYWSLTVYIGLWTPYNMFMEELLRMIHPADAFSALPGNRQTYLHWNCYVHIHCMTCANISCRTERMDALTRTHEAHTDRHGLTHGLNTSACSVISCRIGIIWCLCVCTSAYSGEDMVAFLGERISRHFSL
jgi:hypothetical protein